MKSFTPHPYQDLMIRHALDTPRCALWAGMGMGKTSSTLSIVDTLRLAGDTKRTLVLAPKRVARSTWPDENQKWEEFAHLKVQPILGTQDERRAALRNDKADIYTINYDNIPWLVSQLQAGWPFDTVIADESTRLKNFRIEQGGKRAHALAEAIDKRTRRWINLTGLAAPNGLQDLWGQTWFLDKGFRLGRSYSAFENRWFGFQRAKDAVHAHKTHVQRVVFPHAQTEIQNLLKDICLALDPKDWFDLDDPIVRDVYVDLPPEARKNYRDMEREMFTAFKAKGVGDTDGDHAYEVEAFNAASKSIKCLQICAGAAYVEGSTKKWVQVHDEKLDALESIIAEAAGTPVLVSYHFKPDLARILTRFSQARPLDANPQTITDWNAGRIPILVAHPASAGHGLNLQDGGNILVYFSHWWALEDRAQILERVGPMRQKQAGHDRPVWVYNIIARDTVDEQVIERVTTKRAVADILHDAMKRREL